MSTPSRSRSSAIGSEDYFNWRENMERRQRKNERQMQVLLHETRRLREDNEVLCIQVSSSTPPRSQQPKSQCANSNQNEEVTYPRNAEFFHNEQGMQSEQKSPLACHVQPDESFDSTRVSAKMRRNRKSQLSDAMRARLGPQMLGMGGNCI
ncbi:hypothetical protein CK203_006233 [Vitis vinifera]|uniref:Uncharacterized protein n=2 Tax=Vitis vinifera TaxID=29760 RepID=A0A438K5P0_VITVI|nr:hypothetical protein CK203_006233 [Vitis vinifera]CAN74470.1 hypothetical protein VITISV_033185 [Vitis vinifera]